jgi:acyl carrier protein
VDKTTITTRLHEVVGNTLNVDPELLDDTSSPETLREWTSVCHLTLMAAIEREFDVIFSMEEMTAVTSVASLRQLVTQHIA